MTSQEVLYLGPFNPESVVQERKLPFRNPAAFNRMSRLAQALALSGKTVTIVSSGVSLNIGFAGRFWHRAARGKIGEVGFILLPAVGLPVIGFLLEPLILSAWLAARVLKQRPAALMVYNATIASAFGVALAAALRVPVIYEVEDVPDWQALTNNVSAEKPRRFQHLSWLIASKIQIPLSRGIVVPSRRFLRAMGVSGRKLRAARVLSGCMEVTTPEPALRTYPNSSRPLQVLFSGKLENEHGYDLLLGAIGEILSNPDPDHPIEFHICGRPSGTSINFEPPPMHPSVHYHGFLPDSGYQQVLARADVGLALQKASGIFSETRTPSKAYEFLASGKLVIGMRVGDLDELYPDSALCLENEDAVELAALLKRIAVNPEPFIALARTGLETARERYSYPAAGRILVDLIPANT
jgi:glycosyltransferase involved in cell wall biosynthesis